MVQKHGEAPKLLGATACGRAAGRPGRVIFAFSSSMASVNGSLMYAIASPSQPEPRSQADQRDRIHLAVQSSDSHVPTGTEIFVNILVREGWRDSVRVVEYMDIGPPLRRSLPASRAVLNHRGVRARGCKIGAVKPPFLPLARRPRAWPVHSPSWPLQVKWGGTGKRYAVSQDLSWKVRLVERHIPEAIPTPRVVAKVFSCTSRARTQRDRPALFGHCGDPRGERIRGSCPDRLPAP
jgi:hypothetical protein